MMSVSVPSRPLIFISHIHEDAEVASLLEESVKSMLLGSIDIFNTSGRASLSPGDPWRDRIVERLRSCVATLVVASPDSVRSPWVNFESGGAWISGKAVIPCCIRGMKKSSLPAPLSHLQALELSDVDDLKKLVEFLADQAGLTSPPAEYDVLASRFSAITSSADLAAVGNTSFLDWVEIAIIRPKKFAGESCRGVFAVAQPRSVTPIEANQFIGSGITPGESIRCWVTIPTDNTLYYCFANGEAADMIAEFRSATIVEANLKCLGQIKVYETEFIGLSDEERGISYHEAFLVEGLILLDVNT